MTEQNTETAQAQPVVEPDILDMPLPEDNEISEESEEAKTETEETDEESESEETEEKAEQEVSKEKPQKESGFKRRIRKKDERIAALEAELAKSRNPQRQPQQKQPTNDGAPNPDDFEHGINDINYIDARTEWRVDQGIKKARQAEQQEKAQAKWIESIQKGKKNFDEKFEDALEKYPELEKKIVDNGIDFTGFNINVTHALESAKNAGEIMRHLAENPEDFDDLTGMSVVQAISRIGELNAKLTPTKVKKVPSKMGEPVKTVGNGKPNKTGEWNEDWTTEDFLRNTSIHDLD